MRKRKISKVAVIGMGPVGMILSTHLKEAEIDVAVCDLDKVKMNKIRVEGVELQGCIKRKSTFSSCFTSLSEVEGFQPELLFLCLKTTQLPAALKELSSLSLKDAGFVCSMNGIDVENSVSACFGEGRTLRMVINFAGNILSPNQTNVTFFNPPNYIASMDDSREDQANEIAALLTGVDLQTELISSFGILKCIWEKAILNSSLSALCAVGRMTIREAMSNSDMVELVEQIIEEAVEVAEAEKIRFEDDFIRKCLRYLTRAGDHFPSLAVDLLNNRPTEIDFLNGKIVEYGRKHYIRTSLNLTFTNMVKAISDKKAIASVATTRAAIPENGSLPTGKKQPGVTGSCFLGVDLGSAYTKFTVLAENEKPVYQLAVKTLNREKISVKHVIETLKKEYPIAGICATGYGRKHLPDANLVKTEINCAAMGVSSYFQGEKNIIDIGGEDIKIIKCRKDDSVENFYLNDKCAAGTGSFITEIAERADIRLQDMSDLATKSNFGKELNSFCTVFAKTEVMSWLFEGMPMEDIARGIYISIINRVLKLRIDPSVPIYLIGGVVAHHPFLAELLRSKLKNEIKLLKDPQHIVSLGAALYAKNQSNKITTHTDDKQIQN